MSSDRARVSFDPSRRYRGVVTQQGRVTIEADVNEAAAIAAAERRADVLDLVGPSGTPDGGYLVGAGPTGSAAGDLSVGPGTFYVGGERVVLTETLDYAQQPDWIDTGGDPLWVAPAVPTQTGEVVYLLLREQEVSAVEDSALIDIALGGPDTSARTRIVQRVVRASTTAADAADSLAALEQQWASNGLTFNAATMRLSSQATLQVGFVQEPGAASLCQPSGAGGYVGAENQLIRVQIASVSGGVPTLVWGYDNASSLYRIAGTPAAGATTLALAGRPVDSYHQPALGQAVEVLAAAAMLDPSDPSDYVAASTGTVTTLAAPYDPTSGQIQLAAGLTAAQAASPVLFLRVWEETFTYTSGPISLGQTGLQINLANAGSTWHVGDYWTFAVRPGTPTTMSPVYPQRLVAAPQPPDGPHMWATQLALVSWSGNTPTITDLRNTFVDLVSLTEQAKGCCTVEITPDAVNGGAGLQALIDSYSDAGPTTICFQPGTYTLPAPLVVHAGASALTLEACMGGVVIEAAENSAPFTLGLIVAQSDGGAAGGGTTATTTTASGGGGATGSAPAIPAVAELENVASLTVRGMVLSMPPVAFSYSASAITGLPSQREALLTGYGNALSVSIGISVFGCSNVRVEACRFYFPNVSSNNLFAAGIYATGTTAGVEVSDCSFINVPEPDSVPFSDMRLGTFSAPPYQACFGYLQMPTSPPSSPPVLAARAPLTAAFEAPSVTEVPAVEPLIALTTLPGILRTTVPGIIIDPPPTSTTTSTTTTTTTTAAPTTPAGPVPSLVLTEAVLEDAVFTRNTFDGLTVPVLVLARLGVVSVSDNTVRACYGGFWFIPADGNTAVALLDLLDSTDSSASSYAVQYGISALTDPVLWLATALARLLPLTPPTTAAPVLRAIALPTNLLTRAASLLQVLAPAATTTTTPGPGAATSERATSDIAGRPPATDALQASSAATHLTVEPGFETPVDRPIAETDVAGKSLASFGGIGQVDTLQGESGLRPVDIQQKLIPLPTFGDLIGLTQTGPTAPPPILSAEPGIAPTPRLDFHGNEVDAIIGSSYSGAGLVVAVMLTDGTIVSVLCNGNRVRGRAASCPVVSLNQVTQCALTGNVISNEIPDPSAAASPEPSVTAAGASGSPQPGGATSPTTTSPSVVLDPALLQPPALANNPHPVPTALVAVTGNVLIGDPPTLPARPSGLPGGFSVWDALNTIAYYVAPPPPPTTSTTTTTTAPS